ncbi:hypothetical protein DFQ14_101280 [Halopolyspora algeriensis]|uniref:Uncharacterized protein n=1 Tax=Halopolyspora algeriensis TaxID=1500506 RepID=A0A368W4F4_9ACTN|nr:hypothetical protein [Halopolyspora algeriensis]RCW46940.1 hypothetical protein DFQ14_101280 [Halopolyspora algeriensis]TQM48031.1 hypothetical protein FHU43_2983 [Halopolyspora algeriensis]
MTALVLGAVLLAIVAALLGIESALDWMRRLTRGCTKRRRR